MKQSQIKFAGRAKLNIFSLEIDVMVFNDNLGYVMHAYTPKSTEEPLLIKDIEQSDNGQPFDKDLKDVWKDIKDNEQLKSLKDKCIFRLNGLTIAYTRFPVLYDNQTEFFKDNDTRECKLYDLKKKLNTTIKLNKTDFNGGKIANENIVFPTSINTFKPYDLLPCKSQDQDSKGSFYPLYDNKWEFAIDIEFISNKIKKIVVLNPVYVSDKKTFIKEQKESFVKEGNKIIDWEYSELLNKLKEDKNKSKTIKDLFVDDDYFFKCIQKEQKKIFLKNYSFDIDSYIEGYNTQINDRIKLGGTALNTTDYVLEFFKNKILNQSTDSVEDLQKSLNTSLIVLLETCKRKYNENKAEDLKTKTQNFENSQFTKDAFRNYVDGISVTITETDITKFIKTNKDDKIQEWLNKNERILNTNSIKPFIEKDEHNDKSEMLKVKLPSNFHNNNRINEYQDKSVPYDELFKPIDPLYFFCMSASDKANYTFDVRKHKDKFSMAKTNQFDDLWGNSDDLSGKSKTIISLRDFQFQLKWTLSDVFRKKLTEVYNTNDVYTSKITDLEKQIEEKDKEIAKEKEEKAKKEAEANVKAGEHNIIKANNNYYKKLIITEINNIKNVNAIKSNASYTSNIDFFNITNENFNKNFKHDQVDSYKNAVTSLLRISSLAQENKLNLLNIKSGLEGYKKEEKVETPAVAPESPAIIEKTALEKKKAELEEKKRTEDKAVEDNERIVKLSDHPELALHPDWFDKDTKKMKFPTLQDRVLTALKEFGN